MKKRPLVWAYENKPILPVSVLSLFNLLSNMTSTKSSINFAKVFCSIVSCHFKKQEGIKVV